ncbi:hypothetical protein ACFSTH_03260 [Paenibacillus yanchengensis]|uniref:Uncharacterized protein n=1 Tax=Paenibacillus yanchengensis TaxID=2035833 RepID=A0ABW4YFZ8_9BACL
MNHPVIILGIYEIGFTLVAILIFSQLILVEVEEGILKWLMALPLNKWTFLLQRWLAAVILLLGLFTSSIAVVHGQLGELSMKQLYFEALAPSFFLGNVAIVSTLIGRSASAGLGIPLFYVAFETLSRGSISKAFFLFNTTISINAVDQVLNRQMIWISSFVILGICGILLMRPGLRR